MTMTYSHDMYDAAREIKGLMERGQSFSEAFPRVCRLFDISNTTRNETALYNLTRNVRPEGCPFQAGRGGTRRSNCSGRFSSHRC